MPTTTELPTLPPAPASAPSPVRGSSKAVRPQTSLWHDLRQAWRDLPTPAMVVGWALLTVSALALWSLVFVYVLSGLEQRRTNSVLYSQFRSELTANDSVAPLGGAIEPGRPVALIEAPVDGLRSVVVVEGTASEDLTKGPGHRRNTPLPGQAGTSMIYGRSLTYGAPFGDLDSLRAGQKLTVTTGQGVFQYVVEDVRHEGDPLPVTLPAGGSRLILETSTGPSLAPNETLLVDARLQGDTAPTPPGRVSSVPKSEQAMQGDTSHTLVLVLWLEALLLVAVGIVWSRVRWGKPQTWIVGIPLLVLALWGTSSTAMLMLPNLI